MTAPDLRARLIALADKHDYMLMHGDEQTSISSTERAILREMFLVAARMALEDAAEACLVGDGRIYTANMAGILAAANERNAKRIRALAAWLDNG